MLQGVEQRRGRQRQQHKQTASWDGSSALALGVGVASVVEGVYEQEVGWWAGAGVEVLVDGSTVAVPLHARPRQRGCQQHAGRSQLHRRQRQHLYGKANMVAECVCEWEGPGGDLGRQATCGSKWVLGRAGGCYEASTGACTYIGAPSPGAPGISTGLPACVAPVRQSQTTKRAEAAAAEAAGDAAGQGQEAAGACVDPSQPPMGDRRWRSPVRRWSVAQNPVGGGNSIMVAAARRVYQQVQHPGPGGSNLSAEAVAVVAAAARERWRSLQRCGGGPHQERHSDAA